MMKRRVISLVMSIALLLSVGVPALAAAKVEEPEATEVPEETEEPYESPIDFEELQETNPDIYGWLKIEDTKIDFAVVQHPDRDEYYLTHNSKGEIDLDGAIFSQATYNSKDFDDPVTVLYGHNMKAGRMFGTLRASFTDQEFFDEHKDITIYTPEEALVYKVFAAVPYSNELIPYEHDFEDEDEYTEFFEGVFRIRNLSAKFDEENAPEFGDHVLILSTCISGTPMRFLVMATLESDLENRSES